MAQRLRLSILVVMFLLFYGCGQGSDDGSGDATGDTHRLALEFERITSQAPNPFRVTATLYENGRLKTGASGDLEVQTDRGVPGAVTESSAGQYQFTVTPQQTGEHTVTVTYQGTSIARTALVLASVHPDWGQPMAVPGLVNTAGYEDGVTITPDGEYLFVQYGPIYFSAMILFNLARDDGGCGGHRLEYPTGTANRCTHTWIDTTIGPVGPPERPGFYDGRFSGTTLLHNSNLWGLGVEASPIFAPLTMFYGFRRQADGSYAEPFYLAFEDENDAIMNPFGLSFMLNADGTSTLLYTFDDPGDPYWVDLDGDGSDDVQSYFDVYTTTITLGRDATLGAFAASGVSGAPPVRGDDFPSRLVNFGTTGLDGIAGTQGNAHLYYESGQVRSIWTDDEYDEDADTGLISVQVLLSGDFPDGNWEKAVLPDPVNDPAPSRQIQPFFSGGRLYFTRSTATTLPEIYAATYSGEQTPAAYRDAACWDVPEKLLGADPDQSSGRIIAIGEPTIAVRDGHTYLYFVYGYVRGFDPVSNLADIDMQAGFVPMQE